MKLNNLPYLILAIIAGLTVGIVVAAFASIAALVHTLFAFPIQVYYSSTRRSRELEDMRKNENIWDRHIARMEKKKQQYKDHDRV
mgnify:CR=1 FL=1|tara:strand:- start:224 stop:478 length:255 start_codon:yes stop_codon:yes gene_type:complete